MCDERISRLQTNLQFLATRVPKIILQRVDEIWPALKESTVSVPCICAEKIMFPAYTWSKKINIF
jgi:hypothetical protein